MPTKGLKRARLDTELIVGKITGAMTEAAVTAACIIGQGAASLMTPVDLSTLINSQYRKVEKVGDNWQGRVGYTAAYAAAVHNSSGKLKGQPREHFGKTRAGVEFGGGSGSGKYWDPVGAEPKFLTKGFEQNMEAIKAVIKEEYKV